MNLFESIYSIKSQQEFNTIALEIFKYQYANNPLYHSFCKHLKVVPEAITSIKKIPFLPISFFKSDAIKTGTFIPQQTFLSSGTTGQTTSKHHVKDLNIYEKSFLQGFKTFYGNIEDYCILALLPSYMEREGSSLIYMTEVLIAKSKNENSGFFLRNEAVLVEKLQKLIKNKQKTILIGVSFALLDLAEQHKIDLSEVIIMETGGMKGRRAELTRSELHAIYNYHFNLYLNVYIY